jgi:hypothetical protein
MEMPQSESVIVEKQRQSVKGFCLVVMTLVGPTLLLFADVDEVIVRLVVVHSSGD